MNILHLTTFLQGGAGRAITALACDQRRAGHRVVVVTSRNAPAGYGNYDAYIEELIVCGVDVHLVDSLFRREHAANLAVVRLLQCVVPVGAEPDVIHAHAAIPSLVGLLFAGSRSRPMPIVQTMHGWGLSKTAEQAATDVTLLNLVHRVVVASERSRAELQALGVAASRLTTAPYGVAGSTTTAIATRDRALIDEMADARRRGHLVVGAVGTVNARKNQRLIVDALRTAGARLPVFAVFVGDGATEELTAAIEAAGLSGHCRVHGYSAAARHIGAAADVFVLASRSEGQPLSVLEAFADRVMVVASGIPELVELVDDGVTGLVFEPDNAVSLASALLRVASMPPSERRGFSHRARQVYESTFTAEAMTGRYMKVYREVVHPGPDLFSLPSAQHGDPHDGFTLRMRVRN